MCAMWQMVFHLKMRLHLYLSFEYNESEKNWYNVILFEIEIVKSSFSWNFLNFNRPKCFNLCTCIEQQSFGSLFTERPITQCFFLASKTWELLKLFFYATAKSLHKIHIKFNTFTKVTIFCCLEHRLDWRNSAM